VHNVGGKPPNLRCWGGWVECYKGSKADL